MYRVNKLREENRNRSDQEVDDNQKQYDWPMLPSNDPYQLQFPAPLNQNRAVSSILKPVLVVGSTDVSSLFCPSESAEGKKTNNGSEAVSSIHSPRAQHPRT